MKYYIHVPKNEITGRIRRGYKPGQRKFCKISKYPVRGELSAAEKLKMELQQNQRE